MGILKNKGKLRQWCLCQVRSSELTILENEQQLTELFSIQSKNSLNLNVLQTSIPNYFEIKLGTIKFMLIICLSSYIKQTA
ncbi:MAG: hypothetical protein FWH18_07035 [Marinilabiliaceae bacterium]|nr:hypothetical protein [Marinilabiliaceae bacterium]